MVLNYKSLKDHVYKYLYDKINSGSLKPGEKINENQLCKDLNVSRTPIREALIQLEDEEFIIRLPRRGFMVKEISLEKIKEIYEIIGCLEGFAAHLAVERMNEKDMLSLKKAIDKMDDSIDNKNLHDYFKLQRNFHNIYISACGNDELFSIITSLKKRFVKKAYFMHENEDILYKTLRNNNKGHRKIYNFLEKHDGQGVEIYLRDIHWNFENANLIVSPFEARNSGKQ